MALLSPTLFAEQLMRSIENIVVVSNITQSSPPCFTKTDLEEAINNGRCWIVVGKEIFDLTNNTWWLNGSHLGYDCGSIIPLNVLNSKEIKLNDLIDYYGDMDFASRIGKLCLKRSMNKPESCGNAHCDFEENFLNCPQDCPAGIEDGYCVPFWDFICDPDCGRKYDPNCICNMNGICEREFEDHVNCPNDCPPNYPDKLCYKRKDGLCDPDCTIGEDPDCETETTTTVIIVITPTLTITTTTLFKITCGDGICDEKENFLNCPQDCKSGSLDGYCDEVEDGICDEDCSNDTDPDCHRDQKKFYNYFLSSPTFLLSLITLIIIFVAFKTLKRKKEKAEIKRKREEFLMWKEVKERLKAGENPQKVKEELRKKGFNAEIVDDIL
jgi:hypothetical protein